MRHLFRTLLLMAVITAIGMLTVVSMLKMLYPNAHVPATTELNFSGAYTPLPIGTTVSGVYERANPAVVRITATRVAKDDELGLPDEHPDVDKRSRGIGTGCIIDQTGYIITNQHVVDQAEQVRVRLIDGQEIAAEVIGEDKTTDIALIKISLPNPLIVMPLGDSTKLRIGEPVVAIGNPYSYDRSVTTGIVSAKGRKVFNTLYEDYIQTDAAINVGNSGGPLLNMSGELVGINTVIRTDANGISFAIPVNLIKDIVGQLKINHRVVRGFLGVQPDSITPELRDALGLKTTEGALVTYVNHNSAAAKAGIEVYDVILKFGGNSVTNKDTLYRFIAETPPGRDVEIELIRNNNYKRLVAQLTEREEAKASISPSPSAPKRVSLGRVGFSVEDKNAQTERFLRLAGSDKVPGVVITSVDPLSPAADAGLQRGFIITEANRVPITSVGDFERVVSNLKTGDVVLLRVAGDRGGIPLPYFITAIRIDE